MTLKRPIPILFGAVIFFGTGCLILYLGVGDLIETRRFLENSIDVDGVVEDISTRYVEIGSGPNRSRSLTNVASVRFVAKDGEDFVFEHNYGLLEQRLEPGKPVRVAYQPRRPYEARVDTFSGLWAGSIAMLVLGGMFIAAAFGLMAVFRNP